MTRWASWLAMAVVLVVALSVGVAGQRGPRTEDERVLAVASTVRCPTCRGLSAAESDAKAAQAVREEIRSRLREGRSPDSIRAYLVSRYGQDVLLEPAGRGVAGLVWVLPVVAAAAAAGGLALVFGRWRRAGAAAVPTDDDRRMVADALGR